MLPMAIEFNRIVVYFAVQVQWQKSQIMANSQAIYAALSRELRIDAFHDVSNNGLQVASGKERFAKVCTGVDATLPFFEQAAARGADLVVCHHGISWGDSLCHIDGLNYGLVSFLIRNDIALWTCHLPLDAHPTLGNNAQICKALGLCALRPFYTYHGETIGFKGEFPEPMAREAFLDLVRKEVSPRAQMHAFGPEEVKTVGVVSGGAADGISQAIDEGLDAYITGETNLQAYNACLQRRGNMVAAGHYATERFGVRAIGEWLAAEFGVAHEFIDFDIPL